ncbi:phage tail tape measure protein TP901 family [Clostridium sp. CAG:306]|nr:phage tail tape measure protein TP901 family [Clostridium sp. CAG:306]
MLDTMMKISLSLVAIDKMSRVIRDAVTKSNAEFDKLQNKIQKTSECLDKLGQNMVKLGAGLTAAGTGLAYKLGITEAIPEAISLEHQLRELGNVGQLSAKQLEDMDKRLGQISRYTNQFRSEIAEGTNVLVASGIDPTKALDYMNVIGRTATAAQAEIVDISKTAFAVTDNLKVNVEDLGKTMDILAQAGKEGRFELKDMSAAFPSLTAGASMLGMRGIPAVTQLGAALQVAMKGAGSAAEAATNFESFLQAITSPMAVNRFKELYHVDLPKFLNQVIAESKDPIEEIVVLINQLTGGDVFAVSEIFRNKTDLNFLKPMMQNLDEYRRIKASALGADGVMDEDFNHMMETTQEQFKLLKINMKELVFPHLHEPIQKINELLTKINKNPLLQKGIFTAIIGTIGAGLVLTTLGTILMLVGKITSGYGKFLAYARDLTPVLAQNAIKLFGSIGFNTTAHNLEYGRKIASLGNPLGLDMSNFSIKSGIFADIKRIDNNLRNGIIRGFKELPGNITKSTIALKDWTVTSIKGIPAAFINGLKALKSGFLGVPGMIKNAIVAFRAFSLTLLTSPIGWIALAVAGVAFLIFKYWKPITAFFKGVWAGLKEGLAPLMPLFKRISVALEPLIKPIRAIVDWFKKLIKPVEDTGGKAEAMGVKVGKALAGIIVKIVELITKVFEFGKKIGDMLANGILSKLGKTKEAIGKHAQIIRDHLPHSPAKVGPLKDLNKLKIIETIVSTMKPTPLINAMNKNLGLMISGAKGNIGKVGASSGASFIIHYSPTITMPPGSSKEEFSKLLKQHKDEVVALLKREFERKERVAY